MKKLLQLAFIIILPIITRAQLTNGVCTDAITLPVNSGIIAEQSVSTNFTYANNVTQLYECNNFDPSTPPHVEAWYEFTATNKSHYLVFNVENSSSENNSYYNGYTLYSGECENLVLLDCRDIENGAISGLTVGNTYKVFFHHVVTEGTSINITLSVLTMPLIETNNTQYTNEQLVTNVLINSPCLTVNNVSSTTGTGININGISYFENGNSTFPFQKGILLSTGNALSASYPPSSSGEGDNTWPGDEDLNTFMSNFTPGSASINASSIEFDFTPQTDHISFDYIFASNEYGLYQCNFSDAFAFLLTDMSTGETKNMAVVPGTNMPVSVTTIRNNEYNAECQSVNADYFGDYNFIGTSNTAKLTAAIGFTGNTIPLTAESYVVPGHLYHIKLVIADRADPGYDSAVFIDAGSFNIGSADSDYVKIKSSNGHILCGNSTTTLSLNLNDPFSFVWLKNGVEIPDANTNSLIVNESGNYTIVATLSGVSECTLEFNTNVFISPGEDTIEIIDYVVFETNSDGIHSFDLTTKTEQLLVQTQGNEFIFSYHLSQQEANNNINPLPAVYNNIVNPQTIYTRIQNSMNTCFTTSSFLLVVLDETYTTPMPTGPTTQTFTEGETLADIEIEGENILWYDTPGETTGLPFKPKNNDTPLPLSTVLVNNTTYYASQTLNTIESTSRLAVTVTTTMGTDNNTFTTLKYYPNPVNDVLTITNSSDIEALTITNTLGQTVISKQINNNNAQLDLSSLNNDVYFVKISVEGKNKTLKIIKQ